MTTASELKSAAVVEVESKASKTSEVQAVTATVNKTNNATELDERCSSHDDEGFTFNGIYKFSAASIQATRLPLSVFSNKSRLIPIQQNPVPLWQTLPERALRA
jgi:hypothetical protein